MLTPICAIFDRAAGVNYVMHFILSFNIWNKVLRRRANKLLCKMVSTFTKDDIQVFYLVKCKIALEIAKQIDAEYKFYNSVSSEKD